MTNILITGGDSFIARTIKPYLLKQGHSVFAPSHGQLNVENQINLINTLNFIRPDVVINCAVVGGRRNHQDSLEDFYNNLLILNNLLYFQDKFKFKLILFSSAAEFDRRVNIFNAKECECESKPVDFYGLSKNIQTKTIRNKSNIINLRLFNVFGNGMEDSFIPVCINNCLNNKPVEIWEDKFFSTFYAEDLALLIHNLIEVNSNKYIELNCGYIETYKLSDLARLIKKLTKSNSSIIMKRILGKSYHGNFNKLNKLNLKFIGLEEGIKKTIEYIQNYANKH